MAVNKSDPTLAIRMGIMIGGFLITIGTIVWGASAITGDVNTNTTEIHRVDVDGCKPSVVVRRDLVGVLKDVEKNSLDLIRVEGKIDKLIERQDTVVELLREMAK